MTLRYPPSLALITLALTGCGTVLPLPGGNAPSAPETSIEVEGRWVCTPDPARCGSKFEHQVFGGGPVKLTLKNYAGPPTNLRWVSSLGNDVGTVQLNGTDAAVTIASANLAERGIPKDSYQVRVTATDAVGNTVR